MRFSKLALVASAFILAACGGKDNGNTDTATAAPSGDTLSANATTPPATTGGAVAPITGTTHEVKMIGDEKGYRFEPANLTIKAGDGVRWTMVSGGPHNVAFDPTKVAADVKGQLSSNMPNQMAELSSPLMMNPNEQYTISFANVKAGKYDYICTPHAAMGMSGSITVQ